MDKIDSNILNYYLKNVLGFLHSEKKVQAFPGIEKNIENILVEIAVHHTYSCENLDNVSKTILEHIKAELIKNQGQLELICTFQELACGTRSLIYTKKKVTTMKEASPMRQPLSMKGPLPMQPLRKPNSITSKSATPSSLINSSFKLKCLNATLKFVKDDSTLTLRYPDMASEQADFLVNMFQQRNVDSDIGLGYKTMYAPLWEAMKIFGLKYKFTLRHVEAKSSDMKCLILDKLPIISRSRSDKTNQDQQTNTPASTILTFSTDNLQTPKNIDDKNNDANTINKLVDLKNDDEKMYFQNNVNLNAITDNKYPKIVDILVNLGPTYITELLNKILKFLSDEKSASLILESLTMQEVQIIKNFRTLCSKPKYLPLLNENSKILAQKITEKLNERSFGFDVKIDKLTVSEKGKITKCKRLKDTFMQNVTIRKLLTASRKRATIVSSPTSIDSSHSSTSLSSNSSTSKQSLNSLSSISSQFSSVLNLNDEEKSIKAGTSIKSVATPSNINTKPATNKNSKNDANSNNIIIIPTITSPNSTKSVASNNNKQPTTSPNSTKGVASNNNKQPTTSPNSTKSVASNSNKQLTTSPNSTKSAASNNNKQPTTSPNSTKSVASNNNKKQPTTSPNSTKSVASNSNKQLTTSPNSTKSAASNNNKQPTTSPNSTKSVASNNNKQPNTSSISTKSVASSDIKNPTITSSNSTKSAASSDLKNPTINSTSATSLTSIDIKKPTITSSNSTTSVASSNTKPGISASNSTISVASGNKLNKTKQKLLDGLNQPVVSDKATKMMLNMGWSGGGLGAKEEGIIAPVVPGIDYFLENKPRLGLGGLEIVQQTRAKKQQKQQPKTRRSQSQQYVLTKREYHIMSLETILRLLTNSEIYHVIELPEVVFEREWSFVKHLMTCFNSGFRQHLIDERQIDLVNFISCIMSSGSWRLFAEGYFDQSTVVIYKEQVGPLIDNIKIERDINGDTISIYSNDGYHMKQIFVPHYNYNPNNFRITFTSASKPDNIKTEGASVSTNLNKGKSMKKITTNNNKKQTNPPPLKPIMLKSEGKENTDFQNFTNLNDLTKKDQKPKQLTPIVPKSPEPKCSCNKCSMNNQNKCLKSPSVKCDNTCASLSSVHLNFKSNFLAHVLLFCKQDVEVKTVKFSYNLNENEKEYIMKTMSMIRTEDKCVESGLEEKFHEKIHNAINGYTVECVFTLNHSTTLTKKFNSKAKKLIEDDKENQNNNTHNNNCKSINNNNIICENNSSQAINSGNLTNSSQATNSNQATNSSQVANSSQVENSSQVVNKNDQQVKNIFIKYDEKYKSIDDLETSLLNRSVTRNKDTDNLFDNDQIASSSSQVENSSSQVVKSSSQVVNNSDPFINDIDKKIDDIPVVIANDEEEYLLLNDEDFTKNGLANELQELRDLYNEEKTENDVIKTVNIKTEPENTEDIPKIKIENIKEEFIKEPSPGKRSRSNSESTSQESKIPKKYAKRIAIVPKDYPQEKITQQTAREIQILIKDSIDNYDSCSNLELPLLKCNGLQNGELQYCCFTEKSFYFIEDLLRNSDFKIIYGMSKECPGIRMTLRINSFFVENTDLTLKRLAKYNKGLYTKEWKVIKRLFSKDCDLFLIEIDEDSYNYIREASFSLFAGIDKVMFNHYGD